MSPEPSWPLWAAALVGGATLLAGWLAVMSWFGVDTAALGWMLVALVAVVGIALRPLITDLATGMVLTATHSIQIGDVIRCGTVEGTVRDRLPTLLRIEQTDGTWVTLAHRHVLSGPLVNLSRARRRQVQLSFTLPLGADVDATEQAILGVLANDDRILESPPPVLTVSVIDDEIRVDARAWVEGEPEQVQGRLTLVALAALPDRQAQVRPA